MNIILRNSKLIDVIRRINANDWKAFSKFLKSPYFNSNKKLIELHKVLTKYYPTFSSKGFTKEKVYRALFSNAKKVDEKQLANLMSQMRKCCDVFFTQERLKEKPRLEKLLLSEYYSDQNWYELLKKNKESLIDDIENESNKLEEDYFLAYMSSWSFYHRPETLKLNASSPSFNLAIKYLSLFTILEHLKLGCELKSRAYFLSDTSEVPLLAEIIAESNKIDLAEVKVYRSFIQLLEDDSDQQYKETSELFFKHIPELSRQDKLNLFNILLNLTNRIALKGAVDYYRHLFDLYKIGLKNNFFILKNFMHTNHFSNIVFTAVSLGELKWVDEFILGYNHYIVPKDKKVVLAYCNARVSVEKKDFDLAFNHLQEIEEIPHEFNLRVRSLFLRCIYEMYVLDDNYYDLMISKILSFEKYIVRDKVWDKKRKKSYLRMCFFLRKFSDLRNVKSNEVVKKMQDELHVQPVIAKTWLLDKLNQLSKHQQCL